MTQISPKSDHKAQEKEKNETNANPTPNCCSDNHCLYDEKPTR